MMLSFWACPWARRCCLVFHREVRTAWRECDRGNALHKALYPCGFENPVVRYNAAFAVIKSMEKPRFPQFSWGFMLFFPFFADFHRFWQAFLSLKKPERCLER
jgi:hypothetical protein